MTNLGASLALTSAKSVSTGGYYTGSIYVPTLLQSVDPRILSLTAAVNGRDCPDFSQPFTYADFGCGLGWTLVLLARMFPNGEFYGVDMNPAHIRYAIRLAERAGVKNAHFIEAGFESLAAGELPKLDFAIAHGVISWVADDVYLGLLKVMAEHLKPNGLAYLGYNTPGGFEDLRSFVELLKQAVQLGQPIKESGEFAIRTWASGNGDRQATASLLLRQLEQHTDYFIHEYLNDYWIPRSSSQIARHFAMHGFTPLGPWHSPMHSKPLEERPIQIEDPVFWEDAIGARKKVRFRNMIYSRNETQQKTAQLEKRFAKVKVVLRDEQQKQLGLANNSTAAVPAMQLIQAAQNSSQNLQVVNSILHGLKIRMVFDPKQAAPVKISRFRMSPVCHDLLELTQLENEPWSDHRGKLSEIVKHIIATKTGQCFSVPLPLAQSMLLRFSDQPVEDWPDIVQEIVADTGLEVSVETAMEEWRDCWYGAFVQAGLAVPVDAST